MGGNEAAGIDVRACKLLVYCLSGFCAAWPASSSPRTLSGQPTVGETKGNIGSVDLSLVRAPAGWKPR